ncbi:hypothetical protein BASA81_003645 [Batrachochytrium salamandrivorans]|nr:hypothetical protein BASA81_003645 [Batrachochytrium salamandrivorans]
MLLVLSLIALPSAWASLSLNLVDCSDVQNQFCPNSFPPPNVVFPPESGQASSTSLACCKTNFLQCQNQLGTSLCRTLFTYTISPPQGNSETVCPVVPTDCTCQQGLAAAAYMGIRLCPTPPVCCPTCECHGDPHCTSFDTNAPSAVWAVCDDRGKSCLHTAKGCSNTTYGGKACVWSASLGTSGECIRAPNTPVPVMNMYTKHYKSYFNSQDNTLYTLSIDVGLALYGVINQVNITDAGVFAVFSINAAGKCQGTAAYPLSSSGLINIRDLPSNVVVQLKCVNNAPKTPQRWDITYVRDPWYVPEQIAANPTGFAGYCTTNLIPENTGGNPGGCSIMDRQVSMYYGCNVAFPISICKAQFCTRFANRLAFPGATGTLQAKCNAFAGGTTASGVSNFVQAACSLNTLSPIPVDPSLCLKNYDCKVCVDMIYDFPDQVAQAVNAPVVVPTPAPTITCPGNLVPIGLNRKSLSTFQSGVQIDFNNNGVWTGVFALLDDEIAACGGCENLLFVNGSVSSNLPLLNPGQYRVSQCTGLDTDSQQALCTGPPGYNATVTYSNLLSESTVSQTFGSLFDAGDLVCAPSKYPNCPVNYQCCIWSRSQQPVAWQLCMDSHHNGANAYPNCNL